MGKCMRARVHRASCFLHFLLASFLISSTGGGVGDGASVTNHLLPAVTSWLSLLACVSYL